MIYIQCSSIFGLKTLHNSLLPNSVGTTCGNVQQMNYIWTKGISTWTMCSLLIDIHSHLSWREVYAFMTAQKNSFEILHLISNWKNRYVWLTKQVPYLLFINSKMVCINCCRSWLIHPPLENSCQNTWLILLKFWAPSNLKF